MHDSLRTKYPLLQNRATLFKITSLMTRAQSILKAAS